MKNLKKISFTAVTASIVLALAGCGNINDILDILSSDETDSAQATVSATNTETWTYDEDRPIHLVTSNVQSLTVTGDIAGKNLYLVQVNPGNAAISSKYLRIITKTSQFGTVGTETKSTPSGIPSQGGGKTWNWPWTRAVMPEETEDLGSLLPKHKHFAGEELPSLQGISSRSAVSSPSYDTASSSAEENWEIGDTKSIYVDTDSDISTFVQKSATLRASSDSCYVWVVDDYYAAKASGDKIDSDIAKKYADKFEAMYPYITNVFGDESEEIINYTTHQTVGMQTLSDTGTKINIVVYDIGADYSSDNQTGVVGYFYAKDYYYAPSRSDVIGKSNIGKYFYIDSGYAVSDFNTTISTLAHEFQHMIDFNQKNMLHNLSPDTNYNEMLSMLCEDMMQEKLELEDYASPKSRIQSFNAYYYISGIREYYSDYAIYSYSTAYAFGSWLARQYGGAELVKAISTNEYVNNDSFVKAVNEVNNTSKTFDSLFEEFLLAVTGVSSSYNSYYTHNQDAKQNILYGTDYYKYPMTAFNLWSDASSTYTSDGTTQKYTFSLQDTSLAAKYKDYVYSEYDWNGPLVLSNTASVTTLRPVYGMAVHGIGKYGSTAKSDTITFSTSGAQNLRLYVIIQ